MMNPTKNKIKALEKVLWDLRPYIGHARHCTYSDSMNSDPDSDYCTCNLKDVVEATRKALAIKI